MSQYCLQLSLLQQVCLTMISFISFLPSQYCLQLSLLQRCMQNSLLILSTLASHNTACSYHCCNGVYVSEDLGAELSHNTACSYHCCNEKNKVARYTAAAAGHNTACSYHCCNLTTFFNLKHGITSQYCLQLSLLQQQGFKTLTLSGVLRSFLPTKQIFRSFCHFSAFFYQHQIAKLPYHNGLRLVENLNCTFASHRTKTNI